MSDISPNQEQPTPLVLTHEQRAVLEALKSKETEEYPLSKWYLGALYALGNPHNPDRVSQAAQSLRELVEKLPRVVREGGVQGNTPFAELRRDIHERLLRDKERYTGAWEGKEIDGQLTKTLEKIDRYLELNRHPTRKEQVQTAIAGIDPMVRQLDRNIREKKRDTLHKVWRSLEGFAHHRNLPDVEKFRECLEELERTVFDLLAPITAQDQREIQSILKLPDRSERDVERMLSLIERRGANFAFFFKCVTETADTSWLSILKTRGYFDHPRNVEPTGDGRVSFLFWSPISYLVQAFESEPEKVLDVLEQLPDTDNPLILGEIMDIILKSDSSEVIRRLRPKIMAFMEHVEWADEKIIELLKKPYTIERSLSDFITSLVRKLVESRSELLSENEAWGYNRVLYEGVRPLAERAPYRVASIMIDVMASIIRRRSHLKGGKGERAEDGSEVWCPRLDGPDEPLGPRSKETFGHTLAFACNEVYQKEPESIKVLDRSLRNQPWKFFTRLRQHLYTLHPSGQTQPWIRELILAHKDYAQREHNYEFQRMILCACEHFGATLLTEEERARIFKIILSGPLRRHSQKRTGEQFVDDWDRQQQRNFNRKQFRPFASVLFDQYASYYRKLEAEADEQISDEDYVLFRVTDRSGTVVERSPQSPEDLANLTDEELLAYVNEWQKEYREWQEEHRDKDNWWLEVSIKALAQAFQTVFKDAIIPNAGRLRFWLENRARIERPIYVRAIVSAMQEHVKAKHFDKLGEWLTFCEWVLSHPDPEGGEGTGRNEKSRENPHWHSARWAVCYFIECCLHEEVNVPASTRSLLAKLLDMLCTQFDWQLDRNDNEPIGDDLLDEALNNTRSRALERLIEFGLWLRRHDPEADVSEVIAILEKRLAPETERPLSLPECAILGRQYGNIFLLDETWATAHKTDFFPQDNLTAWLEVFSGFLIFNSPFKPVFEICRAEFDLALKHLDLLERYLTDVLGRHLFTYYWWDVYPLRGKESLLERYYRQTDSDRAHWAAVFGHVGWLLQDSGKHLDNALKDRIIQFFAWRLEVGEPTELEMFILWLKAECLEPEWRLNAYSRILDVVQLKEIGIFDELRTLEKMLPDYTAKVVKCFAKITDHVLNHNTHIHKMDQAKAILKAGLESGDESVRENAERARENLLRGGRFDFLELDD